MSFPSANYSPPKEKIKVAKGLQTGCLCKST